MATLNSDTGYYELDSASTLGLHLEAGASDGLIAQAHEILATQNGSDTTVQEYLDSLTSTATANKVASADSSVTITESTSGTDLSVNIDNDTLIQNTDGTIAVSDEALVQYVGEDAIEISGVDTNNEKTVSLTISSSDTILSQSSSGLIANLSITERTSGLDSENYRAQYDIYGKDSTLLGSIPVYKDSTLSDAYLGTTTDTVDSSTGTVTSGIGDDALCLVYYLADGTYSLVAIDVSSFLRESEFSNGLQVSTSGVVSVLIDSASETYLTVSSSGVKLSGIDDAIAAATDDLDSVADALPGTVVTAVGDPTAGTSTVTYTVSTATKGDDNTYGNATSATKTIPAATSTAAGVMTTDQVSTLSSALQSISAGTSYLSASTSGTAATVSEVATGVTAGNYGPSASSSPGSAGTFSVPYVTVNTYGKLTAAATQTITMPTVITNSSLALSGSTLTLTDSAGNTVSENISGVVSSNMTAITEDEIDALFE